VRQRERDAGLSILAPDATRTRDPAAVLVDADALLEEIEGALRVQGVALLQPPVQPLLRLEDGVTVGLRCAARELVERREELPAAHNRPRQVRRAAQDLLDRAARVVAGAGRERLDLGDCAACSRGYVSTCVNGTHAVTGPGYADVRGR